MNFRRNSKGGGGGGISDLNDVDDNDVEGWGFYSNPGRHHLRPLLLALLENDNNHDEIEKYDTNWKSRDPPGPYFKVLLLLLFGDFSGW